MKRFTVIFTFICLFVVFTQAQFPVLTKKEIRQGWVLLFDGKTSTGWKHFKGGPFPNGWIIENGVLTLDNTVKPRPGDIITEDQFSDFELSLEFRTTKGANSGIKYFILPGTNLGLEFQILDDENHPDAKQGKNGNRLQGGLYDLISPKGKKDKPIGEWNQARIISKGNHVEHWLNGKKVVTFERGSDAFKTLINGSKYKDSKDFSTPVQTPILLQDHGNVVSFRNIKIRKLK
jgi:hypothetical protein